MKKTRDWLFGTVVMWVVTCAAGLSQEATPNDAVVELTPSVIDEVFDMYFGGPDMLMTPERLFWRDESPNRRKFVICGYETKSLQGRLEIRKGLGFVYQPAQTFAKLKPGEHAIDTFKYKVFDGNSFDWRTVRIEVRGDDPRVKKSGAVWHAPLASEALKLIRREIDLLEKRAKAKLTPAELTRMERSIDGNVKAIHKWFSKDGSGFTSPKFVGILRNREAGSDIDKPPHFLDGGPSISLGFDSHGIGSSYEASFKWSASEGQFVNQWSEDNAVDEQYYVKLTGTLLLEIRSNTRFEGRVIRVHEKTHKRIIDQRPVVLKGSEALVAPSI